MGVCALITYPLFLHFHHFQHPHLFLLTLNLHDLLVGLILIDHLLIFSLEFSFLQLLHKIQVVGNSKVTFRNRILLILSVSHILQMNIVPGVLLDSHRHLEVYLVLQLFLYELPFRLR